MSTELQRKLAKQIGENILRPKPKNKKELVVSSGYAEISGIKHAKNIIKQKGVQEELVAQGFTLDNAKRIIGSILNSPFVSEMVTPENQIRAAQEVFKVTGSYPKEGEVSVNTVIIQFDNALIARASKENSR